MTNKFFNVRQRSNELTTTTEKVRNLIGGRTGVARYVTLLLLTLFTLGFSQSAWAEMGFYDEGTFNVQMNVNGSSQWIYGSSANRTNVAAKDLGYVTNLTFGGYWAKAWSGDGWKHKSVKMYAKVDNGSFANWYEVTGSDFEGNKQYIVENKNLDKGLISGKALGSHTIKFYFALNDYRYATNVSSQTAASEPYYVINYGIPGFTTTSTSKAYGNVAINSETSSTISFGTHYGTALTTSNCSITGDGASSYAVTAISESGVTVKFNPTSAGSKPATLTITDEHSKTCTITLSGTVPTNTLTWTLNGGTIKTAGTAAGSVAYGATLTAPVVEKTGYTFSSWSPSVPATMPNSAATYAAQWTANQYNITLDEQGATTSGSTSVTVTYDAAVPTITKPAKKGYTFGGYYTQENGGGKQYIGYNGQSANVWTETTINKLYAKWTPKTTNITLDNQGADTGKEGTTAIIGTYDQPLPSIIPPEKTGYDFVGYYNESGGTKYINADGTSAKNWNSSSSTLTLYAHWTIHNFAITYAANATIASYTSQVANANYGTTVTVAPNPITDYAVDGITVTKTSDGSAYSTDDVAPYTFVQPDYAVTVTVRTHSTAIPTFLIRFLNYDGTVLQSGQVNQNTTPVYSGATPTKTSDTEWDYTFNTWTPAIATVTKAQDYTATYNQARRKYALAWDYNGGSLVSAGTAAGQVANASSITAPTLSLTGYTQNGWDPAFTGTMPAADVTYVAQWNENKYQITFDGNGATSGSMADQTNLGCAHPQTINSNTFARTGYDFLGWSTVKDGDKVYDDGATVAALTKTENNSTLTLYAKWQKHEYTISYTAQSTGWTYGTTPTTGYYGDNIQFEVNTTEGYTVTVASTQAVITKSGKDCSFTMPASDVTVNVSATENLYDVTLNCDIPEGATLRYDDVEKEWGSVVSVGVATTKAITVTLKPGYKFNGSFTTTGGARAVGNSGSYTISANGAEGTVTAKLAEDLTSDYYLEGNAPFGGWTTTGTMMTKKSGHSADTKVYFTVNVPSDKLSPGSNEWAFKIYKSTGSKWYGWGNSEQHYYITSENNAIGLHSNSAGNLAFRPTVAGNYIFELETSGEYPYLTVTYPTSYKVNFGVGDGGSSVTAKIDNTTAIKTGDLVLSGSSVTFHYTAESGYRFTGWYTAASGGNLLSSTDADYVTTISAVTNVYAQFEEIKHTVTVSAGANGSIDPVAGDYQIGVVGQTFTPTPATGYYHKDWTTTGGASVSNNKITANDKGTATANFHERFVIRGSINESGNPLGGMGGWSGNDSTVVTNIDGNVGTYTANLTEGNKQYKFKLYDLSTSTSYGQTGTSEMQDGVQRTLNGTNDVLFTTTVPGIYTFTVDFSTIAQSKVTITYPVSHVVTFGVGDGTSGNVTATVDAAEINSGDRVLAGKTVTFTAPTAATYYKWKEWNTKADGSGDPLGTNNTLDIVLSKDTAVYATYQPITYTITANNGEHGTVSPSGSVEVNNVNYTTIEAVANGGYTFDHWEVSNVTLEGANTVNPARVKASASGGSITAMYRAAKVVYFKDVLGWGGGYCYLFSASPWDNTYGVQPKVNKIVSGAMTLVDGTTDVYKYEFDATYSPAFIAFSKDDKTEASHFNNTQASYRGDLNIEYPMFVPATTKNETKQGTDYYSSGTWFKFATNKGYKVNFGGEDVDFVFESAGSLTASVTAPSWTSYTDYQVTIKDVRTSSTTNYGKTDATLTYLASGPQTLVSNSDYITVSALSAGDYTLTLSFEAATTTPQLTVTYPQAYTITYGVGNGGATAQAKRVVNGDTTDVASGEYVAPGTTMFINQTPAVGCTFVKWNTRKNGTGTDLSNTPQLDFTMPAAAYVAYPLYSGALETSWCLVGTFNTTAWQEDGFMHQSSVGSSEVVYDDIELAAGREYEFKVKDKSTDPSTYYGNTGTITQAHCSDWTMNSSENCKIATTIAGTYQFAFNTKTKKLSVIYPDNATRAELYSSPVRDENTDIMIQAYYWAHVGNTFEEWTQYGDVKWGNMVSSHEADTLAKYFNLVWLAPSQQTKDYTGFLPQNYSRQGGATAGASEGFPWGSSQELRTYIDVLHQGGAKVVADVVINHSTPTTGWCTWDDAFDFGRYGSYEPDLTWITNQDEVWSSSESGNNCKDYAHSGNYDDEWKYSYRSNDDAVWGTQDWTYTEYNCAYSRDWAHKKADVREMTRAYLTWLRDSIGYDGFRFDFAKGLHGSRIQDYVRASAPYFAVSEVFDRDMQKQKGFLHDVGDQSYVFNFPGKCYHINAAIGGGSAGNYNLPALKNNHQTMIYGYQKWTVNFVENHDTFRETGNGDKNICDTENSMCDERRILQANAYILAMPGVPCIFYPHFHEYPNQIKAMIKARRAAGVHSQSAVTDWAGSGGSGNNWYEAQVKGSKGYVYIKLGVDCSPTYAPTDRGYGAGKAPDGKAYVCAYQGTHVSVWYTTNEETTNEKYRLLVTSDGETFYSNEVEEVGDTLSYYATEDATYQWQKYTMYEWRNCSGIAPQNIDTDYVFISTLALDGTTPSVENEGLYQGDYYIRTDEIEGGWSSYKDSKHLFTYFENVSVATGDPYHYYWVENIGKNKKVNVRATVANRFNKNLTNIIGSDKFTDSDGNVTGDNNGINIRFSYEPTTNKLGRAMILGASNNRFLNVVGDNIYKEKACTTALNEANYTSTPVDSKLGDISNWVYERTVFVKIDAGHPSSNVVIKSVFNDITQYMLGFQKDFYGNETDEPIQYPVLDAGTTSSGSSAYCIRVIYDFKTNRLVGAWEPVDQVIDKSWNIDADVLFKRFENGNTAQITFANDGDTISSLKNVLFIMEFHRDTLPKQENLYWFSLPYDCHINSIYGVEGYVTLNGNGLPTQGTWGIQRYDGETRAKTGWFKEDTQTFWKWMSKDEVLKAGEGYILDFDKSVAKFSEIDVEEQCDTCASGTRKVKKAILRLYFPSDKPGFSMTKSGAVDSVVYTDHTCNIKNRKAQDSNWRLMSPGNYSNTTIANEKDIRYDEKDSTLTPIPQFIYTYDRSQEAGSRYTAVSALNGFTYKSFNCYMAQFSGAVKWAQYTKADATTVAARQYYAPGEIRLANLKLVMENSYGEQQDHTFIKLKKGATTGYDANADLTKIVNSGIGQVYSVSEDVDYAANVLPVESQTVALKVVAAKAGSYTFSMPEGTDGVTATLVDTQTGSRTDLGLWNYTVELGKDTYAGRFYLDINIHQTPTNVVVTEGDSENEGDKMMKFIENGQLYILKNGVIYDATGKIVK